MNTLTESQIRNAFVNASKGEAKRAALPDLESIDFSGLDYLGWQDAKRPRQHYVALEVDDELVVLLLRGAENPPGRKMMCAWCEDVVDGLHAASFVAPLAGAPGRRGNSIGTSVCADFSCSRHVRRLRAKLGDYAEIIRTVRGEGYRFDRHADVTVLASGPSPDRF